MRRFRLAVLLPFLLAGIQAAGQAGCITNIPNRPGISLDGKWHYLVDPYETGYYNYRRQPYDQQEQPNREAYFADAVQKSNMDRLEYNFAQTPTLQVPGSWGMQVEQLHWYEGTVWYQRKLHYRKPANKRLFLHFEAANYESHVYVNGKKAGTHKGGFTPFDFEVTQLLLDGENSIVVKVDNTRRLDGAPTVNTDWWNHGGITRSVHLLEMPPTFIRNYKLQLSNRSQKTIQGWIQLDGQAQGLRVRVQIPELRIDQTYAPDQEGKVSFEIPSPNLSLWSPQNPKLYQALLSTEMETVTDQIGFRTIETRGSDLLLNGKKIFLRGISMHEENPVSGTRIATESEARMMLDWANELNANFVRLAHYPHSEYMARLADQMGILLWEEIPVYWTIQWENTQTLALAQQQLTEMIARDQNRASVIIWSMANETPVSDVRNRFLKSLVDSARALDPTRLISAALEVHGGGPMNKVIDDPFGEWTDIVSFNQYHGWYGGNIHDFPKISWDVKYPKPVIVSEWGGGALYGLRGDSLTLWTEDYQAHLYKKTLEGIANIPGLAGFSPWILADFRSPRRPLTHVQDMWNRKGLIGEGGHKKLAFRVLQTYYQKLKAEEPD